MRDNSETSSTAVVIDPKSLSQPASRSNSSTTVGGSQQKKNLINEKKRARNERKNSGEDSSENHDDESENEDVTMMATKSNLEGGGIVDPFKLVSNWPSMGQGKHSLNSRNHHEWIRVICDTINDMKKRIVILEAENESKTRTIDKLASKITELESKSPMTENIRNEITQAANQAVNKLAKPTMAEMVSYGFEKSRTSLEVDIAYATKREMSEKEKRASNLMIFGLSCTESAEIDRSNVHDLLATLKCNLSEIKKIVRLRSNVRDRPPPVLVELICPDMRRRVLEATKALRGHQKYGGVSISADLTVAERLARKKILEKCRSMNSELETNSPFKYQVRHDEIKKIDIRTNTVYKSSGSSR